MVPTPERQHDQGQGRRRRPHPESRPAARRRGDPRSTSPIDAGPPDLDRAAAGHRRRGDATTPTDHADRALRGGRGPKRLVMQRHTTHYAAYDRYWTPVTPLIVEWFERYLVAANLDVRRGHPVDADAARSSKYMEERMTVDRRGSPAAQVVTADGIRPRRRAGRRRARSPASSSPGTAPSRCRRGHRRHRQARAARHGRRPRPHPRARATRTRRTSRRPRPAGRGRRRDDDLRHAQPGPADRRPARSSTRRSRSTTPEVDRRLQPQPGGDEPGRDRADGRGGRRAPSRSTWSSTPAAPTRTRPAPACTTTATCCR